MKTTRIRAGEYLLVTEEGRIFHIIARAPDDWLVFHYRLGVGYLLGSWKTLRDAKVGALQSPQ